MRVLFVCTGNICRSPFAEGLAHRLARERGLDGLEFASAGTHVVLDGAPDEGLAAARAYGVDLGAHRSRQLTAELVSWADAVVVMARHHLDDPLLADAPAALFATGPVRDPWGLGPGAYRQAYADLERAVESLLEELTARVES